MCHSICHSPQSINFVEYCYYARNSSLSSPLHISCRTPHIVPDCRLILEYGKKTYLPIEENAAAPAEIKYSDWNIYLLPVICAKMNRDKFKKAAVNILFILTQKILRQPPIKNCKANSLNRFAKQRINLTAL